MQQFRWISGLALVVVPLLCYRWIEQRLVTNIHHTAFVKAMMSQNVELKYSTCQEVWKQEIVPTEPEITRSFLYEAYTCYLMLLEEETFRQTNQLGLAGVEALLRAIVRSVPDDAQAHYALAAHLMATTYDPAEMSNLLQAVSVSNTLTDESLGWIQYWQAQTHLPFDSARNWQILALNPQIIGLYYTLYEDAIKRDQIEEAKKIEQLVQHLEPRIPLSSIYNTDCIKETNMEELQKWGEALGWGKWTLLGIDFDPVLLDESPYVWVTFYWQTNTNGQGDGSPQIPFQQVKNEPDRQLYRVGNRVMDARYIHNLMVNPGFEWIMGDQLPQRTLPYFYSIWKRGAYEFTPQVVEDTTSQVRNHVLEITTVGSGNWEPNIDAQDFLVETNATYIQGGMLGTGEGQARVNLGRMQFPPEPNDNTQPGLSWGVYQITTQQERRYCTSFWRNPYATHVWPTIAVLDLPGKVYVDHLFFFKLPQMDVSP